MLILETCIYLGLLLFLVQQKSLMSMLKALSPPYQIFLAVLVIVMLGAQLIEGDKRTFPFVVWSMYMRPAYGDPQYFNYSAVSQNGREMQLDVLRMSRTLFSRLMFPLRDMARKIDWLGEGSQRQASIADYETILRVVALMYNRRNPDDLVRTIYVWHCTIPLQAYRSSSLVQRRLLWQLQVQ